jgi:hypothetical protein
VTPLATLTASSTDTPTSTTRPALTRHGTHFQRHRVPWLLINNVEVILDADLHIGSAGLLRGGAVAWVQVEMADTLSAAGVEFRPFLTATTSNPDVSEVWLLDGHFFSEAQNRMYVRHPARTLPSMPRTRCPAAAAIATRNTRGDDGILEPIGLKGYGHG